MACLEANEFNLLTCIAILFQTASDLSKLYIHMDQSPYRRFQMRRLSNACKCCKYHFSDSTPKVRCIYLFTVAGMKHLASQANKSGRFETVIHNAGTRYTNGYSKTEDGVDATFAINSLAPYVLTCLMERPQRLLYTSSDLHSGGDGSLEDVGWSKKRWKGFQAYSDSKLHDVVPSVALTRRWKDVQSNAIDPGWVATMMGGAGAPGTADAGADTLSWLGGGNSSDSGKLYKSRKAIRSHEAATNVETQAKFLKICEQISGVPFPT